jgi:hypothetical protein
MADKSEERQVGQKPNIEYIGRGIAGDKADQLAQKAEALQKIGFHIPPTVVLRQGFFDNLCVRNGLGNSLIDIPQTPNAARKVANATFPQEDFETLQLIFHEFAGKPLLVRSSAKGDARGTGTYTSMVIAPDNIGLLRKAVMQVTASYFSEDATEFRKHAQTGEGFGIIIQPMVGQELPREYAEGTFFAPIFSGSGYTSTLSGSGYTNIVPGFGSGVDTRNTERLHKQNLERVKGNINDYIYQERLAMIQGVRPRSKADLFELLTPVKNYSPEIKKLLTDHPASATWHKAVDKINFLNFFKMMHQMEETFGKPQYFEWAVTVENEKPVFWILQIADVDKAKEAMINPLEFEKGGTPFCLATDVHGSGMVESKKLVYVRSEDELEALRAFNKEHTGYVVGYPQELTTKGSRRNSSWQKEDTLQFSDLSHAAAVIEFPDSAHSMHAIEHFGGQMEATGKFFGVVDEYGDPPLNWGLFGRNAVTVNGLQVLDAEIKVVADERRDKMVIYINR